MEKYNIIFIILLLTATVSCKKNMQEDKSPAQPPTEKKWVVTTIAGEGTPSFSNGPVLTAKFHFPEDLAIAANGTIYITDVANTLIRKILDGQVSTFAGSTGGEIVNGTGASAKFKSPYSITTDAAGNFYTTDENDPRIRKISPNAEVSTYAGTEIEGFADGNSATARFYPGNSIVADRNGNVYVADYRNSRIRIVSTSGHVSTLAGNALGGFNNGNGGTAKFNSPGGITIDTQGNLYIVDRGNFLIRKITPSGDVSTFTGSGTQGNKDGNAGEAQFSQDMRDIIIDGQGNLYISDFNRIRKITPRGVVSTIAGSTAGFADGDGSLAKFDYPNGLAIDGADNIYVADLNNNRIRKISFE